MSDTVREIENGYEVTSGKSGKTYTVRTVVKMDACGSYYGKRICSCPAGQHGRRCHHIDAAEQHEWDEAIREKDYDGMDMLERIS